MRLIIKKGTEELELALHPAILQALWDGKTSLTTQWVGWSVQGLLSRSDVPLTLRTRQKPDAPAQPWGDAGLLSVTLTADVDFPTDAGFLPHDKQEAKRIAREALERKLDNLP